MKILSSTVHNVDVLVIGAGQAGICAAYELQKRGFTGFAESLGADDGVTKRRKKPALGTFVVLDAEEAPGGAWQHRWPTLTMATVNHIADLPGQPVEEMDPCSPARIFVPAYFAEFEYENDLPILRPVRVYAVTNAAAMNAVDGSSADSSSTGGFSADGSSADGSSAGAAAMPETAVIDGADAESDVDTATVADNADATSGAISDRILGDHADGAGALAGGVSVSAGRPVVHSSQHSAQQHLERQEEQPRGLLEAHTSAGIWRARFIINCTGTWQSPFVPYISGAEKFRGQQYHTQTYPGPERFWKQRVLVVGGGVSAINHVEELASEAKKVRWVTRTPPRWRKQTSGASQRGWGLAPEAGRDVEAQVRARAEAGLPPLPVVAHTGLPLTEHVQELRKKGVLKRRPMFDSLDADGAWWGSKHENFDAIIWATGFRHNLRHLRPLRLRSPLGGIQMEGVHTALDPRIYLIGYGSSASTVGARRDARIAAREIKQQITQR